MSNAMVRMAHARRAGMGELGVELNPVLVNAGYTSDSRGNVYYPDGTIMSGPDVLAVSRPRTQSSGVPIFITPASAAQTYILANGQQVQMTPEQYQQFLAAQGGAPGSLIASGLGTGFEAFARQFGVSSTTLILLFVAGAYLLFKPPPERKR